MLNAEVVPVGRLTPDDRARLFAIHARHYEAVDEATFAGDLATKQWVVLVRDGADTVCGFSTLRTFAVAFRGRVVRLIYSGDTVIARTHWGSQALPLRWIEFAGRIKSGAPDTPLFWLLTTKGDRTYRYLAAFAHRFHPDWRAPTPGWAEELGALVGKAAFGARFDPGAGVVRGGGGALRAEYRVPPARLRRADVAFFEARNPHHAEGDELVCLCELSSANLRPIARRRFEIGLADGPPEEMPGDNVSSARCS